MTYRMMPHANSEGLPVKRRTFATALATLPFVFTGTPRAHALLSSSIEKEPSHMIRRAFVYTETQANIPFHQVRWNDVNDGVAEQPGFIDKTWLSGHQTNSVGGLYSFDSIDAALSFCTDFFPSLARDLGVAHSTRVFDGAATEEASADMNAPHFGGSVSKEPGAFVYTEVQVSRAFEDAPWRERNPELRRQKGLISKLWLSGLNTQTLGGLDAFDSVENALDFAINAFPKTAVAMNAAFYTRVFDARVTEAASRGLNSPYYQ